MFRDDIDHAISVTIRSFINSQKHSVKKALSKVFDKYLSLDKDQFELLNHVLSELVAENMRLTYYQRDVMPDQVELDMEEFEMRV